MMKIFFTKCANNCCMIIKVTKWQEPLSLNMLIITAWPWSPTRQSLAPKEMWLPNQNLKQLVKTPIIQNARPHDKSHDPTILNLRVGGSCWVHKFSHPNLATDQLQIGQLRRLKDDTSDYITAITNFWLTMNSYKSAKPFEQLTINRLADWRSFHLN